MGVDISISLGASHADLAGANPYNSDTVLRAEQVLLRSDGLPPGEIPSSKSYYRNSRRVGNPPFYFWALRPLTHLGFREAATIWIVLEFVASAVAFFAFLTAFGWRRRWLPCLLFLAMPETLMATLYGNANVCVFVGIALALAIMHKYPFSAGAVLSLTWVKLQVALPIALLIILFNAPRPRQVVAGLSAATLSLGVLTLITTGWQSVARWGHELVGYSQDLAAQGDMPTLSAWYSPVFPAPVRLGFEALLLGFACALTAWWWWRNRYAMPMSLTLSGWLWCVWMLATPFNHWHDEILLAPVIAAMVGRDAIRLSPRLLDLFTRGASTAAPRAPLVAILLLYVTFIALLPTPWSFLPILLIAITLCAIVVALDPRYSDHQEGFAGPEHASRL